MSVPEGISTKVVPYEYQIESFEQAVSYNTILVLSTGMGKTLISIMTLMELKNRNKGNNKFGLFLVDRVPLVVQQAAAIREYSSLRTLELYGEINDEKKRQEIAERKTYDIIVATAQSVVNLLKKQQLRLDDVFGIVFDECHNANEDHAFIEVMNYINIQSYDVRPRILGLSASICSEETVERNIEKILHIERKLNSRVFRPTSLLSVHGSSVTTTSITQNDIVDFTASAQEVLFRDNLSKLLTDYVNQFIKKLNRYHDVDLDDITNYNRYLYGLRKLRANIEKMDNPHYTKVMQLLLDIYEVFTIIGVDGVHRALNELDGRLRVSLDLRNSFMKQLSDKLFFRTLDDPILKREAPRYETFLEIFKSTARDFIKRSEEFRTIVFVDTRFICEKLVQKMKLDQEISKFNPKEFVGHGGESGMDTAQQKERIKEFKEGLVKILVATNVLEEGLDIKDCNLVICYDGIQNLKSLIQRRGRARSNKNSKFLIICAKEKRAQVNTIIQKETTVSIAISKLVTERKKEQENREYLMNMKDYSTDKPEYFENPNIIFLSIYHIQDQDFETNLSKLLSNIPKFRLLSVKKVHIPSNEEFMQISWIMAIEFLQSTELNQTEKTNIVLSYLNTYEWWCKIPTQFDSVEKKKEVVPELSPFGGMDAQLFNNVALTDLIINIKDLMLTSLDTGKAKKNIFQFGLVSVELGNFYRPNNFTKNAQLTITPFNTAKFNMGKREFHIQHDKYNYFLTFTDLLPYCVFQHFKLSSDPEHQYQLQFYLLLIRPGKITKKPFPNKESTIRTYPLPELKTYGSSFVYKITLAKLTWSQIEEFKKKLKKYGFEVFWGNINQVEKSMVHINYSRIKLKSILYLFDCLSSNDSFGRPCFDQKFVDQIADYCDQKKEEAAKFLLNQALNNKILFYDLSNLFHDLRDRLAIFENIGNVSMTDADPNRKMVKFVVMTPSRMTFKPESSVQTNRIIRKFNPDRFLLFHFQDDRNQKLSYLGSDLKEYLENVLVKNGVTIGDQVYRYLGGSQSQMKNVGCWLYNESDTIYNIKYIREWMGRIPKFPRKFLRSMGILFSATSPTIVIEKEHIRLIKEERPEFTEGCGTIGSSLVEKIIKHRNYPTRTCSFQIRFGGYKGVVSIDPNKSNKDFLILRESMKKFETFEANADAVEHRTLEIISISTTKSCHLSRPLITLLSGIGAPDAYFLNLFHQTLTQLTQPLNNTEIARSQLSQHFSEVTEYELLTDNYLKRIQVLYYKKQLGDLQQKFNIEIPHSRNLLGIADETKKLKEGQVFIQIIEKSKINGKEIQRKRVITGLVGVTRNPSTHPGDIRFLDAVENDVLESFYTDVIVFSQMGRVPSFKESSGGDLDGDRYFVFYDQELLKDCQQELPSGFQDLKAPLEAEDRDICSNNTLGRQFCQNLQKGYIGDISNAHLAICDMFNVKHRYALELSSQHFKEVDVNKHGEHGIIPDPILKTLQQKGFPHFMQKAHDSKSYYDSSKVLGIMYDQCIHLEYIGDQIPDIEVDKELVIEGHEIFLEEAHRLYTIYKAKIQNLMKRYSASSEEELTIGFFDNPANNFYVSTESKEDAATQFKRIGEEFRQIFLNQFNEKEGIDQTLVRHSSEIEKKISAWYYVAYSDKEENKTLSFYWTVKHLQRKKQNVTDLKYTLTKSIYEHLILNQNFNFQYGTRYNLLAHLNGQLEALPNSKSYGRLLMTGSTCLLLMDQNSDFNLFYRIDKNMTKEIPQKVQIANLEELSLVLEGLDCFVKKEYEQSASHYSLKFTTRDNLVVTISMDISSFKQYQILNAYIQEHPFLLPFFSTICRWGKSSYLIESEEFECERIISETNRKKKNKNKTKNSEENIIYLNNLILLDLAIEFCLKQSLIQRVVDLKMDNFNEQDPTLSWEQWKPIVDYSTRDNTNIGAQFLSFLDFYNKTLLDKIFISQELTSLPSAFKKFEKHQKSLKFFQETFLVGYHSLSHSKNIVQFFENCTVFKSSIVSLKNNKNRQKFKERYEEIKTKLDLLNNLTYQVKPNLEKPTSISLKGNNRVISEATNIIRGILQAR